MPLPPLLPGQTEVIASVRNTSDAIVLLRASTPESIQRFVDAILADPEMKVGPAAIAAGFPAEQGRALLLDSRTQRYMAALTQELRETHRDLRMQAIHMLATLASYDPAECTTEHGVMRRIRDIPPNVRAAIKSYQEKADGTIKIEWIDRLRVIELLMKQFGDIENTVTAPTTATRVIFRNREGT